MEQGTVEASNIQQKLTRCSIAEKDLFRKKDCSPDHAAVAGHVLVSAGQRWRKDFMERRGS